MIQKKVFFDTNSLLIPGQFGVDIFTEAERLVPSGVLSIMEKTLDELADIVHTQKGKDKLAAILALRLIKAKGLKTISLPLEGTVDDQLLAYCDSHCVVATQDLALRKKLIKRGITLLVLRTKSHFVLI